MSTQLPDTGARTEFETGARRDASVGKGLPSNIPPSFLRALAKHYEAGREKYANIDERTPNWMLGIPLSRFVDSTYRHLWSAIENDVDSDPDHLISAAWNIIGLWWTLEEVKAGRLPAELNDLPFYARRD